MTDAATKNAAPLNLSTLAALPSSIRKPQFARDELSAGILHFGPGNFHRAHQAVYLGDLMNRGEAHDWAIVGASVMPGDKALRDALIAQDCLYSVTAEVNQQSDTDIPAVMIDYLPIADREAIISRMSAADIRIVSTTVTEGGYFTDAKGDFDPTHPAILEDMQNATAPGTVFGMIVAALARRRQQGLAPFTVMSCDNLPHNGKVVRAAVCGLADGIDPALAGWIDTAVSFPNGMVDRITPATGALERQRIVDEFGLADQAPVFCEDFRQWVLEDDFCNGRPNLDQVGVEFVSDVTPFETMKIRILNGGHAIMAYPAALLDIEYAHDAIAHPLIREFLLKVEQHEILPLVPEVPGIALPDYLAKVVERVGNARIGDTTRRLCFDGSNRQPKFIVPTLRDAIAAGRAYEGLALESALWCRYCYGESESGRRIEPNDPSWDQLTARAREARERPAAWLAMKEVYGELAAVEPFGNAFARALQSLWQNGTEATLQAYSRA